MVLRKAIFYVLFALATLNLISGEGSGQCQGDSGPPARPEGQGPGEGPPDEALDEARASAMFNPFGSLPNFAAMFGGSRSDDEDTENEDREEEPQSRLFFSSFLSSRLTTCNYTTQAGTSCVNCRQRLTCFRSNVGKLKTCKGLFRYCNNGRCSLFPGPLCNPTTTAATTTVASTTAAATTTAATTTIGTTT